MKTGCIILAGGKGTRLGGPKAWVELGGSSLLQRAVSNLEFLAGEIVIVKAPGAELPPLSSRVNLRVVEDSVSGKGPLAGIVAGLSGSNFRHNLVIACDMPLINRALLKYIISVAGDYQAAVPRTGHQMEPLQAVYSKDCIVEIDRLLARDIFKVDSLFANVCTRFIESDEVERFDPLRLSFLNINTPDDLKNAQELLGGSKAPSP